MATAMRKCERVALSIADKEKILEMLVKSVSYTVITEKFGIGKSTVGDIYDIKKKILKFQCEMVEW